MTKSAEYNVTIKISMADEEIIKQKLENLQKALDDMKAEYEEFKKKKAEEVKKELDYLDEDEDEDEPICYTLRDSHDLKYLRDSHDLKELF